MPVSNFLLIVMFVCSLEDTLQHGTKQSTQDQVHVSLDMLYNELREERVAVPLKSILEITKTWTLGIMFLN